MPVLPTFGRVTFLSATFLHSLTTDIEGEKVLSHLQCKQAVQIILP